MQRNITLTLDEDVIRKARVLAARRNRSVSALLREEISRLVAEDEAYETAKRAALERLERGTHLGGGPLPSRDELHDRAGLR
jgi:predicted transcriptional regulator